MRYTDKFCIYSPKLFKDKHVKYQLKAKVYLKVKRKEYVRSCCLPWCFDLGDNTVAKKACWGTPYEI